MLYKKHVCTFAKLGNLVCYSVFSLIPPYLYGRTLPLVLYESKIQLLLLYINVFYYCLYAALRHDHLSIFTHSTHMHT